MKCRMCGSKNNRVIGSDKEDDCINRRRVCDNCGHTWSTIEIDRDQYYVTTGIGRIRRRKKDSDEQNG